MINKAIKEDSAALAKLHHQTISEGFLSLLGISFLKSLYSFLIKNELVLVFKKENNLIGFVSCSLNTTGIMKRFLFSSPLSVFELMFILIRKPNIINSLIETLSAPSKSRYIRNENLETTLPDAELLSISVNHRFQTDGIGTKLLLELETNLKKKDIFKYKVVAGEELVGANKFYLKNGFVLATKIKIHGNKFSNVYIKELI